MVRSSSHQTLSLAHPSSGAPGPAAAPSTEVGAGRPAGPPSEQGPLPRRPWVLASLAGVVLLVVLGLVAALRPAAELPGTVRDPAPEIHGLTFVDHSAPTGPREVDVVPDDQGLTLLYFGYLSCPDVCPMTMVDIARAQDELDPGQAARTQVAFVTLDPQRDDPDRLRAYLDLFFDSNRLALTAADDRTLDDAREQLGLRYEIEPHDPGDDSYDVAHSALTYVIDDTGRVVRELPFGVTPEEIAAVLRAHLP